MNVGQFLSQIPTTEDGRRVVTLMADPSMTDAEGNPAGFLSLVGAGANMRTFQVVKTGDLSGAPAESPDPTNPAGAEEGQNTLARFLRAVGLGSWADKLVTKAMNAPVDFDAAIVAERLRSARWEATDALWDVIRNILANDQVEDKPAAVGLALAKFSAHILGLVTVTVALEEADQLLAIKGLEPHPDQELLVAAKAGRMISASNVGKLQAAMDAMSTAASALQALITAATPSTASKANLADHSPEDPMNAAALVLLSTAASEAAIKAAKAAGITDPNMLAQAGVSASTEVYKAAVSGPAQPSMTPGLFAEQLGGASFQGSANDPHAMLQRVLGKVSSLATKVDGLVSKIDGTPANAEAGVEASPGLLEIATKSAELSMATAERVSKIAGVPAAPHAAADPTVPVKVIKTADPAAAEAGAVWGGSALDLGTAPAPA